MTEREIVYTLTEKGYGMNAIEGQATKRLGTDLDSASPEFNYIIMDCAPGISAFTTAAVTLADLVIMPTIADFLSTYGMQAFVRRVFPVVVGKLPQESNDVCKDSASWGRINFGKIIEDCAKGRFAGTAFDDFGCDGVGLERTLG